MAGEFRVGFKYKMAIVGDGLSARLEHRFGAGGRHSPSRRTAPAQSGDHRKRCPTTPTQRIALYRLLRRYRQRPQTSSLLPWTRGRPLNSRHLNKEREDLISASIREFFLVRERPSLAALVQEVRRRFAEHQLPEPNYRTLVRRVAAVDARLAATKREGAKAARDKFGR